MKRLIVINLILWSVLIGCGGEKPLKPAVDMSDAYIVAGSKYDYEQHGAVWKIVMTTRTLTKVEVKSLYDELRYKYPENYIQIITDKKFLDAFYKHQAENGKAPDKFFSKHHLGIIRPIGDEWRFIAGAVFHTLED